MIARTIHSPDKDYIGFNVALRSTQATTKDRCGDSGSMRTFEETVEGNAGRYIRGRLLSGPNELT